jgi:uncharacterized protein
MRPVLIVPGIQNSGPTHWQTLWEARHPGVSRVMQADWDHPVCHEWADRLDAAVKAAEQPPIVVAHSLGCLVVAHWAARAHAPAHAALLVAVPDPEGPRFPPEARGFGPVPRSLPGLRAHVVSSHDDPYASPEYTERLLADWGVSHQSLGARGHLNAASGLGDWPEGWRIVEQVLGR